MTNSTKRGVGKPTRHPNPEAKMIQHSKFSTGGYVLHKVMINGTKYSAWFDAAGKLLDAEQYTASNVARPVPARMVNVRAELTKIGGRYKNAA